jgi:hypothetical protein
MKLKSIALLATLALIPTLLFGHGTIQLGPNGGRIFDLDSKTTPHLEVGQKGNHLVIHVLDANRKPMPLGDRALSITGGDRSNPQKLAVEKSADSFTAPLPKGEKFPIAFQLREKDGAKPVTARLAYDAHPCGECKKPEWLCACGSAPKK